ncbi:hypothetical protein BKA70DRAFT_1317319 [Coprinopsis sp. MPI-PUGE-AT-0042]|nr:hypothetical protein BKA70DRAFT_1317319 [Coprinopsis sp. MPI-PUGE-AT-0042]
MASIDSPTFNDKDADIVFLSNDVPNPVRFHIHSKNLEVSTGAFPPVAIRGTQSMGDPVGLTVDEPVQLSEPATVLEILFAFMYPRQHPDLEDTPFKELSAIAEAVEKYQVFPALSICKVRMKMFLTDQPVHVGSWAARHGHTSILDEAAPWMTSLPLVKALEVFPSHITLVWVEYYTSWEKVKIDFLFYKDPHDADHSNIRSTLANERCSPSWLAMSFPILSRFREGWEAGQNPFLDLDKLFGSLTCERACCKGGLATWKSCTLEAVTNLPKFSQFILRRSGT